MQQITGSYINREVLPQEPYQSVCVAALVPNKALKTKIEEGMMGLIHSERKSIHAYTSATMVSERGLPQAFLTKEQWADALQTAHVGGMLTITLQDVKTESRYEPGSNSAYNPSFSYIYYDSYYRYYSFHSNTEAELPVLETEKTYFVETNFYDVESEKLLWSIQSESFNPSNFDEFFKGYSKLLVKQLKHEGLLRK